MGETWKRMSLSPMGSEENGRKEAGRSGRREGTGRKEAERSGKREGNGRKEAGRSGRREGTGRKEAGRSGRRESERENRGREGDKKETAAEEPGSKTTESEKEWDRLCREEPVSTYLVACEESDREEFQKQLLYDVLGPVFFGKRQAGNDKELEALFRLRYGIDVQKDFCEGDEHYEEYQEAQQAIAEGMCIYGGKIAFGDSVLADLAGEIWQNLEHQNRHRFRRINTMLEE